MCSNETILQLYIIRHAESLGNIETNEVFDELDPPLSPHGEAQATALGKRCKDLKDHTLYASPLIRAHRTAETISKNIITDYDLLEFCTGYTENGYEAFDEGYDRCLERAKRVIDKIKAKHQNHENVIIVAHGCFNRFLFRAALGLDNNMSFSVYNTSITKINFYLDKKPHLILHNDISHLREIDGEKLFSLEN